MQIKTRTLLLKNFLKNKFPITSPYLSFVIPFYNEEDSLTSLYKEICESLDSKKDYEFIFIDDGSDAIAEIERKEENLPWAEQMVPVGPAACPDRFICLVARLNLHVRNGPIPLPFGQMTLNILDDLLLPCEVFGRH